MADIEVNSQKQIRLEKMESLREQGVKPYGERYERTHLAKNIIDHYDELEDETVRIAGRIMAKRGHGKTSFLTLEDASEKIQLYIRKDAVGDEQFAVLNNLDIGDIIGVEGTPFKTQKGEISIRVFKLEVLSKSLLPLPEKWHGLKDIETRYRQRYVDLIVNKDVRDTFVKRSQIISLMRRYLDDHDFIEVETPTLQLIPGGAEARPFITHHNALDLDMYMRISVELYLKRLIVGGLEKVYEIGRVFRNEGTSVKHNPEFTMLEVYQAYGDYESMMSLMENMINYICLNVLGTSQVTYQEEKIDFAPPWNRLTMAEAVKKYANVDYNDWQDDAEARKIALEAGLEIAEDATKGHVLNEFFEAKVEDKLIEPTFITEYPIEVSPLAKKISDKPMFTYRFEAFVYARELANAYSELNDPIDQKARFEDQVKQRAAGDDEAHMMDKDFVRALEHGMPPTGGLGIGIDRLIMFLTDSASIRDVILFPTMRPEAD